LALGALLLTGLNAPAAEDLYEIDVRHLADLWEKEHISPADPFSLRHSGLQAHLDELARRFQGLVRLEVAGQSVEGRDIFLMSVGAGEKNILLWSQMHGDEPSATSSLLDLVHFLGSHREEQWVSQILQKYTLIMIPMLNPDGAERMQRRNAQGIDINRDARSLQTPEGVLLKAIRDRYHPFLGFNLHNQNSTTTVGDTGRVATIALLAVAADLPGALPRGNEPGPASWLTKQVTAVLYQALAPFAYGHISRYDEEYNPRAFGDNLTLWGTPVVLIDSGGNPAGKPAGFGVQLNFVGLLAVLNSLASDRIRNANPAVFDSLRLNSSSPIYDTILQNAWIFTGSGIPLFRGDIAIRSDMRSGARSQAIIADLGDLGVYSAHQTVDCSNALITPGLIAWNPEELPAGEAAERGYLERGVLTLLETAHYPRVPGEPGQRRLLNWSYLTAADSSATTDSELLRLARWLGTGGRGVVVDVPGSDNTPRELRELAGWFRAAALTRGAAAEYRLPESWQGEIAGQLPHWTSEAAAQFNLPRRGIIAQGALADLVVWDVSGGGRPESLARCRPRAVMINGSILDLSLPTLESQGRFLPRD